MLFIDNMIMTKRYKSKRFVISFISVLDNYIFILKSVLELHLQDHVKMNKTAKKIAH